MPKLNRSDCANPRAVVLLLHGGKERSRRPVDGRSLSWLRAALLQRDLAGPLQKQGLAIWLLRYDVTGWNAPEESPVADGRWALDQIRQAYDAMPVVLVGHSMGARTASRIADDPSVVGVVALAPWFPPKDSVEGLLGKPLTALHGRRDRVTPVSATRSYLDRAALAGSPVRFVDMGRVGHYLLRGRSRWNAEILEATLDLVPTRAD